MEFEWFSRALSKEELQEVYDRADEIRQAVLRRADIYRAVEEHLQSLQSTDPEMNVTARRGNVMDDQSRILGTIGRRRDIYIAIKQELEEAK